MPCICHQEEQMLTAFLLCLRSPFSERKSNITHRLRAPSFRVLILPFAPHTIYTGDSFPEYGDIIPMNGFVLFPPTYCIHKQVYWAAYWLL